MLEKFLDTVMSEYGVFVLFLVLNNLFYVKVLKVMWERNQVLSDKMLDVIERNTQVQTTLVEKLNSSTYGKK